MIKTALRKPRRTLRRILSSWQIYLLILPEFLYILLFNYVPMYGLQIAFRDFKIKRGFWGSEWVGLKYFIKFITYPNCWKIIRNTLSLSLYSLATFPLAILLALLINELNNGKYKKTLQMITYAPHFISTVVVCSMIMLFTNLSGGLINNVIASLGGMRIDFMTIPKFFPSLYVWSGVWQNIGWDTIIYIATLSGISPDLHEAAHIDGASRLKIIWHINLPGIMPTIIIMLIMNCGKILSVGFEKVYLMQNSLNLDVSQVISTYVYEMGLLNGQYSYSTAIGLFNTIVSVTLLLIVNTIAKRTSEVSLW